MLVVGLGNPGSEYADTRHNAGFMVVDVLADELEIALKQRACRVLWGESKIDDGSIQIILAKPQTFVNESGPAVACLLNYFRAGIEHLIIVHDDLDLPLGTVRIKEKGGSGGHRGLDSIVAELGSGDFIRVRVGIGRPPGRMDPAKFVLRPFTVRQRGIVDIAVARAAQACLAVARSGLRSAMNEYNRKQSPES